MRSIYTKTGPTTNRAAVWINPFTWFAALTWCNVLYRILTGVMAHSLRLSLLVSHVVKLLLVVSSLSIGYRKRKEWTAQGEQPNLGLLRSANGYDIGICMVSSFGDFMVSQLLRHMC
jgi:hypothetical protein